MHYPELVAGTLVRRYKRFLADVRLDDGREVVAHCPNTGSMRAVNVPGCRVWLAPSDKPERKLAWTWELIELPQPDGSMALASVHTGRANRIVEEALRAEVVGELAGVGEWRREARVEGARLDFRRPGEAGRDTYVEVKQVTLRETDGHGYFPDAVSERGRKHLETLATLAAEGHRAVLLFFVAHEAIADVAPAAHLDPAYAETLRRVAGQGVEVMARGIDVERGDGQRPLAIRLGGALPVRLR
ncbi:DNA/RNA nuclease SfsA [Halomonas eurihalina]|uniref:Sugar fermentation stimulation protein homolog n=1 Tax=Halomonas eurihalina TaxID=42566 RepID=A0A5D9CUD9_HALER|nr:DNA/RNA nuclease SfsA [Halomonas eurihalina]MDR5861176.1 DNA/RNA nuclease SfsA [Halomonas eurihalina]TZG35528.1 DNA/RNA nuclease SfsA [Halomonas eurihalina]